MSRKQKFLEKPFPHIVVPDFLPAEKIDQLENFDYDLVQKNNDLYQFKQTVDIQHLDHVKGFILEIAKN